MLNLNYGCGNCYRRNGCNEPEPRQGALTAQGIKQVGKERELGINRSI